MEAITAHQSPNKRDISAYGKNKERAKHALRDHGVRRINNRLGNICHGIDLQKGVMVSHNGWHLWTTFAELCRKS